MTNPLIHETSPYLLQHAHNPVNWYAWGPEALQKAENENKPIFLSIGYAACHWCHVMAHESFEDEQTAQLLNQHFISIKVDREERPDLDSIYMNAVVVMTGQGGWPMSVFLTPTGEPFYGGTYFPPTRRHGMPAFREVLQAIIRAWESDRNEMQRVGGQVSKHLQENNRWESTPGAEIRPGLLDQVTQALLNTYDWNQGGWGRAPRFPQAMTIEYLLLQYTRGNEKALQAATHVLQLMSRGGMYDVVGGGFHRYSTDDGWLVPHFEKMLYDNSQLALTYLHAYLLTGKLAFRQVCTETLDFIAREMTHSSGGFYSSLDADSEGEEGKYYIWSVEEIEQALPDSADCNLLYQVYPISRQGNFEEMNIFQRQEDLELLADKLGMDEQSLISRLNTIHRQLYEARQRRIRPLTDDKVLTSWNALALRAFSQAARYLERPDYLSVAQKNADFLLSQMIVEGRLMRAWRNGQKRHNGYLEDYAGLCLALLDLYQSDASPRWYKAALQLAEEMQAQFRDPQGGFFDTGNGQGNLITRPKDIQDNATPSGNALAVNALLALSAFDEQAEWQSQAEAMLASMQDLLARHPMAFGQWLQGLDWAVGPVRQIALIGNPDTAETRSFVNEIWRHYRPRTVIAAASDEKGQDPGLLQGRGPIGGKPTAYLCQGFVCKLPATNIAELKAQLE